MKKTCDRCGGELYQVPVANAGQRTGLFKRVPEYICVCKKCSQIN